MPIPYRQFRLTPDQAKLVDGHMILVDQVAAHVAFRMRGRVDPGDLVGEGWRGLCHAAIDFDPTRGTLFATYARRRILGTMLDEVRHMDWAPRLMRQRRCVPTLHSLYETVAEDDRRLELHHLLPGREDDGPAMLAAREEIVAALSVLPRRHRAMLWMYHADGLHMSEIALAYGLSESRVSQMLAEATRELDDHLSAARAEVA